MKRVKDVTAVKPREKRPDPAQRAMDRAQRYLSYRPRSASEIEARLKRYGYDSPIIAATINRLENSGLIDDASFAAFWKETRQTFSPRSSRLLGRELRQKGIAPETIAATTKDIDDETEAHRAGYKKARSLSGRDYPEFRRKTGAFLQRRGFDYEVIKPVIEKLWQENLKEAGNE